MKNITIFVLFGVLLKLSSSDKVYYLKRSKMCFLWFQDKPGGPKRTPEAFTDAGDALQCFTVRRAWGKYIS